MCLHRCLLLFVILLLAMLHTYKINILIVGNIIQFASLKT